MIKRYLEFEPKIDVEAWVAEDADVIGKVEVARNANIWYGAVLRGDDNWIKVGENSNIQDGCVVHITEELHTEIGRNVTVGHGAILHGCTIGDNVLIGMGAIVLDGAKVGDYSLIGAGCLVPPGKEIPSGVLAVGSPAKVVRDLTEEEKAHMQVSADHYWQLAKQHQQSGEE